MSKKLLRQAKKAKDNFSPKDSRCPICGANFRYGCDHSIAQARERLYENYISALSKG